MDSGSASMDAAQVPSTPVNVPSIQRSGSTNSVSASTCPIQEVASTSVEVPSASANSGSECEKSNETLSKSESVHSSHTESQTQNPIQTNTTDTHAAPKDDSNVAANAAPSCPFTPARQPNDHDAIKGDHDVHVGANDAPPSSCFTPARQPVDADSSKGEVVPAENTPSDQAKGCLSLDVHQGACARDAQSTQSPASSTGSETSGTTGSPGSDGSGASASDPGSSPASVGDADQVDPTQAVGRLVGALLQPSTKENQEVEVKRAVEGLFGWFGNGVKGLAGWNEGRTDRAGHASRLTGDDKSGGRRRRKQTAPDGVTEGVKEKGVKRHKRRRRSEVLDFTVTTGLILDLKTCDEVQEEGEPHRGVPDLTTVEEEQTQTQTQTCNARACEQSAAVNAKLSAKCATLQQEIAGATVQGNKGVDCNLTSIKENEWVYTGPREGISTLEPVCVLCVLSEGDGQCDESQFRAALDDDDSYTCEDMWSGKWQGKRKDAKRFWMM